EELAPGEIAPGVARPGVAGEAVTRPVATAPAVARPGVARPGVALPEHPRPVTSHPRGEGPVVGAERGGVGEALTGEQVAVPRLADDLAARILDRLPRRALRLVVLDTVGGAGRKERAPHPVLVALQRHTVRRKHRIATRIVESAAADVRLV